MHELSQMSIPSGHGAQGLGQSSRDGQGFNMLLLPKSALKLNASVPSTSTSQSKLPSQKSGTGCAMTGVAENSNRQANANESFCNMEDLLLLGCTILKLKNCRCILKLIHSAAQPSIEPNRQARSRNSNRTVAFRPSITRGLALSFYIE
jgi:hypothetical protein